jgi:hypothetical protein
MNGIAGFGCTGVWRRLSYRFPLPRRACLSQTREIGFQRRGPQPLVPVGVGGSADLELVGAVARVAACLSACTRRASPVPAARVSLRRRRDDRLPGVAEPVTRGCSSQRVMGSVHVVAGLVLAIRQRHR